jgi:hypothetical protein
MHMNVSGGRAAIAERNWHIGEFVRERGWLGRVVENLGRGQFLIQRLYDDEGRYSVAKAKDMSVPTIRPHETELLEILC